MTDLLRIGLTRIIELPLLVVFVLKLLEGLALAGGLLLPAGTRVSASERKMHFRA